MRCRGALSMAIVAMMALPPAAFAAPTPASLASLIEMPRWAIGFHWTYHYDGPTNQEISGFRADHLNDTYTAEVVAENATARGDAWVVRNTHAGTMSGYGPGGLTGTATFTSLSFYYFRKSDLAVLNSTQDIDITAQIQIIGTITGRGHNDSVMDPPFAQMVFGAPADGTPWHIYSNFSSSGWFEIGASPRAYSTSYLVLDYNLSVNNTETATVPAGVFETYNISGGGTADANGTVYNFTEAFLWSPLVQSKVVDEGSFLLTSLFVNRAPVLTRPLPVVQVDAGGSNSSLNLSTYLSDPEGAPFTIGCVPAAPLGCSVAPDGVLTVTADPGVNATLLLNLTADDGLPAGNATFSLIVPVSGPANPNQPPTLIGGTTLTTPEDVAYIFAFASHINDPDDAMLNFTLSVDLPGFVTASGSTAFTIASPANFTGNVTFRLAVYDSGGNFAAWNFTLAFLPVNDPPEVVRTGSDHLAAHTGETLVVSVIVFDVEGDPTTLDWTLDGVSVGGTPSLALNITGVAGGDHVLNATATDSRGGRGSVSFFLTVLTGPVIVSASPPTPLVVLVGSVVQFRITASDPDSPILDFTWIHDTDAIIAHGTSATAVNVTFLSPEVTRIGVTVFDGNTTAGHSWTVTVEDPPTGLAAIAQPTNGSQFPANATVNMTASVDPRVLNATVVWRLNGISAGTAFHSVTNPMAPGNYTVELRVTGLYNGTAPYSETVTAAFSVLPPAVENNTTGGGGPGPAPELSETAVYWPLILVIGAVAAAVVLVWWLRRHRRAPGSP